MKLNPATTALCHIHTQCRQDRTTQPNTESRVRTGQHDGARRHHAVVAHLGALLHHGALADQRAVAHGARGHQRAVTNRHLKSVDKKVWEASETEVNDTVVLARKVNSSTQLAKF